MQPSNIGNQIVLDYKNVVADLFLLIFTRHFINELLSRTLIKLFYYNTQVNTCFNNSINRSFLNVFPTFVIYLIVNLVSEKPYHFWHLVDFIYGVQFCFAAPNPKPRPSKSSQIHLNIFKNYKPNAFQVCNFKIIILYINVFKNFQFYMALLKQTNQL